MRRKVGRWLKRVAYRMAPGHLVFLPLYRLGSRMESRR